MNYRRRKVLGAGIAVGTLAVVGASMNATGAVVSKPKLDPIPSLPKIPTPGKPGDFDFLTGEWRIHHWQSKAKNNPATNSNENEWIEFDGQATVHRILAGIGSVEELRIPARDFSGMGLRLLDVEKKLWSDHWVNAKSGVMTAPGVTGSFENGAGLFASDDEDNGKPVKYIGVWDRITARSCRWRQAVSRDDGKHWQQLWIMDWQRA